MEHGLKTDLFEDLWRFTFPSFLPERRSFSIWANSFNEDIFVQGLKITQAKAERMERFGLDFSEDQILRYLSGTCNHLRRDAQDALERGAAVGDVS
ncbi:MAG TPA: hypothetical protein VGG46_08960 [Terriglobales bacterium]|jgi:hypothetical protein